MNNSVAKIMSKVILTEKTIHIKLLGDSITHGEGGTGFKQNGEPIVAGYSRNKDGYCWAKLFKTYMESQFNCIVTNNACTGENIEFIIDNFEWLVEDHDDIIICAIGTNNRQRVEAKDYARLRQEYMERFYNNITKLHNKIKAVGKEVIFIANIPASLENEDIREGLLRVFHMNDVNDIYLKASIDNDFPLISMYNNFVEYCEQKNISINTLLADELHPNDEGYDVMFKMILKEMGIGKLYSSLS